MLKRVIPKKQFVRKVRLSKHSNFELKSSNFKIRLVCEFFQKFFQEGCGLAKPFSEFAFWFTQNDSRLPIAQIFSLMRQIQLMLQIRQKL